MAKVTVVLKPAQTVISAVTLPTGQAKPIRIIYQVENAADIQQPIFACLCSDNTVCHFPQNQLTGL